MVIGRRVYLHTPKGLGRSQLAAELNRRPVPTTPENVSTMRNWATVTKVLSLLDG
ncbi:hypothetical protein GOTRE_039_02420 [Gordonia terrae NBRC 100016]|uniref:Transposase n=1 Tax=Gordonia terrae NBRC 100016 TaxID=1089454 RepID=A0ABQ0HC01_9ACTN|nr:hypothetical protein GOTRE_039_02420 [Gordonia terrae NBRC 100016]